MSGIVYYVLKAPKDTKEEFFEDLSGTIRVIIKKCFKLQEQSDYKISMNLLFNAMIHLMELEAGNIIKVPEEDENVATDIDQTPQKPQGE